MRQTWIIRGLLTFTLFAQVRHAGSQADAAQSAARYRLSVSVDEVDSQGVLHEVNVLHSA